MSFAAADSEYIPWSLAAQNIIIFWLYASRILAWKASLLPLSRPFLQMLQLIEIMWTELCVAHSTACRNAVQLMVINTLVRHII